MDLRKRSSISLLFSFFLFIAISCTSDYIYDKKTEIPNKSWNKDNIIKYNVDITDTISLHNIFLFISNADAYNYCNLYLFLSIISPTGSHIRDTCNFILMDEKGKWYGKKEDDFFVNKMLYKRNIIFPRSGKYTFTIQQAMRTDNVDISSVGMAIAKSK